MIHLNGNKIVALDLETTGDDPELHEIWNLAVVLLDHELKPDRRMPSFEVKMRIDRPQNADRAIMRLTEAQLEEMSNFPVDHDMARDSFAGWFGSMQNKGIIGVNRKLCPLSQNWPGLDRPMLQAWMGYDWFTDVFHVWYRDLIPITQYLNDVNWFDSMSFENYRSPFPKCNQRALCHFFGVENPKPHDALCDALTLAELYRRAVEMGLTGVLAR